jgi:hypothetical protein
MIAAIGGPLTRAADHGDAPGVRLDPRLDIPDLYAFVSPGNPANLVLIMTLSPLARIVSPNTFHPSADHDFFVSTDADPDHEFQFNVRFSQPGAGSLQSVRLLAQSRTARLFEATGTTGQNIPIPTGGLFRANEIDDPFFFDFIAFRSGLSRLCGGAGGTTGVNFFRGLNVTAIAIEVPRSIFGSDTLAVWGRTALEGEAQIDRNGRPVINTVFMPAALKDAFNAAHPRDDQRLFREPFLASARALGNSPDRANFLADFLLPDMLTIDTSRPTAFPNGRALADDVIDVSLNLVSGGAITTDCVANDSTFRDTFPYWAGPNP